MEYQLIRSRRKTLEIAVQPGGLVVVRAPLRLSREKIEDFLLRKQDWISAKQKQLADKPPEFIDSVVIHELCHILHHDHSPAFWALVRQYDPHFPGKRPG